MADKPRSNQPVAEPVAPVVEDPNPNPQPVAHEPTSLVTQAGDPYSTRGKTRVATSRWGTEYLPADQDLPRVTHEGVPMTQEQAEAVVAEANAAFGADHVRVVKADTEG